MGLSVARIVAVYWNQQLAAGFANPPEPVVDMLRNVTGKLTPCRHPRRHEVLEPLGT